ncbi:6294_t:CDS:2, partial [Entrophospora sp. SA101]
DYEGEENVEDDEEFFSEDDGYDPEAPEMLPYPRKDSITTSSTIDKKRGTHYYDLIRIEHGQLLKIVQNGRPLGAEPFLVGSKPPSEDSMWKYIRGLGFDVT